MARICGICPVSHLVASAKAVDDILAVDPPPTGADLRRLINLGQIVQSNALSFFHLSSPDLLFGFDADPSKRHIVAVAQQNPQLALDGIGLRKWGQRIIELLGGKRIHPSGIVPGGVTAVPTVDKITAFLWKVKKLQDFVDNVYIPDVLAIASVYSDYLEIGAGCRNLLSYGGYDLEGDNADLTRRKRLFKQGTVSADFELRELDMSTVTEGVKYSWYEDSSPKHPAQGETKPQSGKADAYSWVKAPRYDGKVYEVGPVARVAASYIDGDPVIRQLVDSSLAELKAPPSALFSVMGRHLARAISAKVIAHNLEKWLLELKPGEPTYVEYEIPEEAVGMGLIEGSRGALGHWIEIKDKKIHNYQAVVPTTWNASPRDDEGNPGPIEQALIGTKVKDRDNPFELVRIVRSFDPCLACAIH
jgi:hydrogenase large subunit